MDNSVQYTTSEQMSIIPKVMSKFAVSLLIMTIGMILGSMFIPPALASMMPIVCFGMLLIAFIVRGRQAHREGGQVTLSMNFVYAFAAIEGVGLYPLIMYYTQAIGANLVMAALAATFVVFFGLSIYAQRTSRNFLSIGPVLFGGLIVLLVVSIVGIFIQATALQVAITTGGLFIFSGYVLYDIQMMRTGLLTEEDVPMMVLNLFLDFINIFIYLLQLLGIFASDD